VQIGIVGAGAVGLALGARLSHAGTRVTFVVRRPEVAQRLRASGVRHSDPASDVTWSAPVGAVTSTEGADALVDAAALIFCTRARDLTATAEPLAQRLPHVLAVSGQNGVDSEAELTTCFSQVAGLVVRQTCTRVADDTVRALGSGRMVLGPVTGDCAGAVAGLAERLRSAGYDVGLSPEISRDKWLKLCVNLMSAPNALVRREDHTSEVFVEVKARLLEEAQRVLAAAGIDAGSCDGRDRDLDAEIAHQRAALERGDSARDLPLYNAVWTALRTGVALEADRYHQRILELAQAHGLAAPTNERVLIALMRAAEEGRGPESIGASELLG
jgi:2-dehydropantoate 2-reductase